MVIYIEKTVCLTATNKRNPLKFSYAVNNNVLTEVFSYRYLVITVTNNLNWTQQINNACATLCLKLGVMRRHLKGAPSDLKLTVYKMVIRSSLEYATIV